MAQRKLGRGLDALVTLSPAEADGTARIDEAVRESSRASVLSLSGRSVEDFFRVVPVEDVADVHVAERAPPAARAAAVREDVVSEDVVSEDARRADASSGAGMDRGESGPMEAPDEDSREVQYSLFDPVIEEAPAAIEDAPAAIEEAPAAITAAPVPAPAAEPPTADVPPPPPRSEAPTTDLGVPDGPADPGEAVFVDDAIVFVDDAVGGLVLPDVEME